MKVMRLLVALIALAIASQSGPAEAQTAQDLLQRGNRALEESRYVEAESTYRQAIALDPKYAPAYYSLGVTLGAQKKYVEAEASFRQAIALDPKNPRNKATYTLLGGKRASEEGRYVDAEAAYRQAIALDPKYAVAYFNLGNALGVQKKYVEAEASFRQAIALDPKNPKNTVAYTLLGKTLSDQKKYVEAEAAYRQAIALDSNYAPAYYSLGTALVAQKKYAEAKVVSRLSEKVYRAQMERPHLETEAASQQAIALDPKDSLAYYKLGTALFFQKKFVEAENALKQAIVIDPNYAAAYDALGIVQLNRKKYVEAEAAYRQAIKLDPKNASTYTRLGFLFEIQGRLMDARGAYLKAIALDPTSKKARADLDYLELLAVQAGFVVPSFSAQGMQKKYLVEESSNRQAIALDPKNVYAYYRLGLALTSQEKYAEAEKAYLQAIKLDLKSAAVYTDLGDALRQQKKYLEAEKAYRQAIALDPEYSTALNNLGYQLQLLGRLTEARDLYRQATAVWPYYKKYRANLEEVERQIGIAGGKLNQLSPVSTRYLPEDPLTPVLRSVVRILPTFSGKSSGAGSHGTGFVVRRQGGKALILTARHVIHDPDEGREAVNIQVELYGGNLPAGTLAARLRARPYKIGAGEVDLALLEVDQYPEDIQPLRFASLPVKDGTPLTMVGHPGRESWKNITGTLMTSNMNTLLVNSGQMAEGGSGSPVLSSLVEVIGMAYAINEPAAGIKQVVGYSLAKLQATMRQWGL